MKRDKADYITLDNQYGAYLITNHLIKYDWAHRSADELSPPSFEFWDEKNGGKRDTVEDYTTADDGRGKGTSW